VGKQPVDQVRDLLSAGSVRTVIQREHIQKYAAADIKKAIDAST